MEKNQFYKIINLTVFVLMINNCSGKKMEPLSRESSVGTSDRKEMQLSVESQTNYSEDEPVKFKINTGKNEGYLYVVYLDKKGEKKLIYPEKKNPQHKVAGKLSFPEDFGLDVRAVKDCTTCTEEKTTVYVLLSKDPIFDINSINNSTLSEEKKKGTVSKSRGFSIVDSGMLVRKVEFFVK